jgi:hypothetical protein
MNSAQILALRGQQLKTDAPPPPLVAEFPLRNLLESLATTICTAPTEEAELRSRDDWMPIELPAYMPERSEQEYRLHSPPNAGIVHAIDTASPKLGPYRFERLSFLCIGEYVLPGPSETSLQTMAPLCSQIRMFYFLHHGIVTPAR